MRGVQAFLTVVLVTVIIAPPAALTHAQGGGGNTVVTQQSAQWVEGNQRVQPAQGTPGTTNKYNYWFYNLPGEFIQNANASSPSGYITNPTYAVAYANANQPVQSHDWWTGVGLQWPGWVTGVDPLNPVIRTPGFYNEPWQMNFIDLPNTKAAPGLPIAPQGLRLWNRTAMRVVTPSTSVSSTIGSAVFGYGNNAVEESPIFTLGLSGTHPIADNTPITPTQPPWTNVRVQKYSDWAVEMSYASNGSELRFTMANGSPFVWVQRTQGSAPFVAWVGTAVGGDNNGQFNVWRNDGPVLGVTITNSFIPIGPALPANPPSPAAYAIVADAGAWAEQATTDPSGRQSLFTNAQAERAVVIAMPHNIPLDDAAALNAALDELIPYAAQRTVGTQVHYPPIPGSDATVTIGGVSKPLGYDREAATLRLRHAISTEQFLAGQPATAPLQIVFPHHRKAMIAQDKANIPLGAGGQPRYTWRSLKGELQAYAGASYVRELRAYGQLPFLPGIAMDAAPQVNGNIPAQDVYDTMKTWFFQGEPGTGPFNAFVLQPGNYFGGQQPTYVPSLATLFEGVTIADQLAQSPILNQPDPDIKLQKTQVAALMRNVILDTLKEFVGRIANVYTSNLFLYSTDYDTFLGYPEGYGSVQTLNDKHFHWGYFLRSAATIGRRDPNWLQAYMPFFNELRADVANYDRSSTRYPFLRNFSPFYGHSWADGVANGGNGNNQESTSEALNFAAALIELGQATSNDDWVDIGMYLYEEEILGVQQYWLNLDGDPTQSSGTFYNGNWPDEFVAYQAGGTPVKNYHIARIIQIQTDRATFFAQNVTAAITIQAIPLSASHLYFGRDQGWMAEMWAEYVRQRNADPNAQDTAYEMLLSGVQAQLPGTGAGIDDPGPIGALTRVNTPHKNFYGAVNMQGKHWAYSLNALGPIDTSVVADVPNYGVFCKGASGPNCAGGARTVVAYNPNLAALTVTFKDAATGATVKTLEVSGQSIAFQTDNDAPEQEYMATLGIDANRLYLRKPDGYSAACGPVQPVTLTLTTAAGTWRQTGGTTAFPSDTSALAPSIACVPKRPRGNPPEPSNFMPDAQLVRAWTGTFSGQLVNPTPYTQFSIYTNQSLFPGWQLDPCTAGGEFVPATCPNGNWSPKADPNGKPIWPAGNTLTMQVWYDFDSDGTPDRIEWYQNMPLDASNAWSYDNKLTEYATQAPWPNSGAGVSVILGGLDGTKTAPFPQNIPSSKPATVTLYLYGGSNQEDLNGKISQFDVPVSVNASPLSNRASWIKPPYQRNATLPPHRNRLHLPWMAN